MLLPSSPTLIHIDTYSLPRQVGWLGLSLKIALPFKLFSFSYFPQKIKFYSLHVLQLYFASVFLRYQLFEDGGLYLL